MYKQIDKPGHLPAKTLEYIMAYDIKSIAKQFALGAELVNAEPFGSGHINDTYRLTCNDNAKSIRYLLQRINHDIFKDPFAMMENIVRVTDHIRNKLLAQDRGELSRRMIAVINTVDGGSCYKGPNGNYWRVYTFVENAITHDTIESPQQAYEAARMFGWFQRMLTDLPGGPLHETIPNFHNTPQRFENFQQVVKADPCNRAKDVKREIDFAFENAWICNVLLDLVAKGEIPVRVTHNDTKINNVMLDDKTGKGICVIDLDTHLIGKLIKALMR